MTIKVKYQDGVLKPLVSDETLEIEDGTEFEIDIQPSNGKGRLRSIVNLFDGLSEEEMQRFEQAAKRRPWFEQQEF